MKKKKKITSVIAIWLTVIVATTAIISAVITFFMVRARTEQDSINLLERNVEDVSNDVRDLANADMSDSLTRYTGERSLTTADIGADECDDLSAWMRDILQTEGCELSMVDKNGIVIASGIPERIGYDMRSDERSAQFLVLLDGQTKEFMQEVIGSGSTFYDMKYAGQAFPDGSGFLQLGLPLDMFIEKLSVQAKYAAVNHRIGRSGYLLICGEDGTVLSSFHNEHTGQTFAEAGTGIDPAAITDHVSGQYTVYGENSYVFINKVLNACIVGVYPVNEAMSGVFTMMLANAQRELFVFAILFIVLLLMLRRLVANSIVKVNDSLSEITGGNLDERVEVRGTYEFNELSDDINSTVDKLKEYIAEAAARIDADLAVAKAIQSSALPTIFPKSDKFSLYATMDAAKEVGGDFYDFYMLDDHTFGFLIADVSGKSIPGAMFMMTSKAVIKSLAESGLPPDEVFTQANEKLCEGNDAEMFVTAWLGYLDLETGLVRVANAGHNPPLLIRGGKAGYVMLKPGLMLAGMDGMIYKEQSVQLQKGDVLYLYTDGVTEAMNIDEEQYGEDRLQALLSSDETCPAVICAGVSADIVKFTAGAEQSDDITMLCIRYDG